MEPGYIVAIIFAVIWLGLKIAEAVMRKKTKNKAEVYIDEE